MTPNPTGPAAGNPAAEYDVVIAKAEATKASTGSPMIKITADVTTGAFKGKRLWTNIVLKSDSPGAMRVSLKKLAGLGLSREWLAETNPSIAWSFCSSAARLTWRCAVRRLRRSS